MHIFIILTPNKSAGRSSLMFSQIPVVFSGDEYLITPYHLSLLRFLGSYENLSGQGVKC